MTDYRLEGLSPRSFEHLVQALALSAIVPTITPFGDGPDGGREATFDGLTNYGPVQNSWNGHGVIQAKFLTRPRSSNHDGRWAITQLKRELKKYDGDSQGKQAFDYYIFATNVVLTPTSPGGSKDAIISILQTFAKEHALKGFDIWDYDKLRTLIDSDSEVRRTYAAWITPGDVLYELAEYLKERRRDYYKLIIKFLQRELLADQYAKLEQAGHSADEAIPLAQVFFDLPVGDRPSQTSHSPQSTNPEDGRRFVRYIIEEASHSLVPRANEAEESVHASEAASGKRPPQGRHMLIGGPGQGKTTVGQFVCQVFRCALLQSVPNSQLSQDVLDIIGSFQSQWRNEEFSEPLARRIPFRVVLSEYARSLAERETNSLLGYLAKRFTAKTDVVVSAEEIEVLLTDYPAVLILDGLDEVPPSTNRDEVLNSLSDFAIDVASSNIDVLIVASSRPQGYNEEFSPRQYYHHYLLPLTKNDALSYGRQLAKVRFGGDEDRILKIWRRLEDATAKPTTARLMTSPLQVTILTLLVDRMHPPEERWALFRDYYRLIYDRETERDITSVAVLRERREDVDAIHRRAGLLLQIESERSGTTDARLTSGQFERLVEDYLVEEKNEGFELERLKREIIEAASNRLVFLVGLESNRVGFEIRSLQEFMAAEGLMDGRDEIIQERLKEVAPSTNWRNTFLFAAGKCFTDRRHLRDTIESICLHLNDDPSNPEYRQLGVGSRLALDLLEDGPARRQPIKRRSLTRLALELLGESPNTSVRLAGIWLPETTDIFIEVIRNRISAVSPTIRRDTWVCLAILIDRYGEEFEEFGRSIAGSYQFSSQDLDLIVDSIDGTNHWLSNLMFERTCSAGAIIESQELIDDDDHEPIEQFGPWKMADKPDWFSWYSEYCMREPGSDRSRFTVNLRCGDSSAIRVARLFGIKNAPAVKFLIPPSSFPTESLTWRWIASAGAFCSDPNVDKLIECLTLFKDSRDHLSNVIGDYRLAEYPWPLTECMLALEENDDIEIADLVQSDAFGDYRTWLSSEESWYRDGVALEELSSADPIWKSGSTEIFRFPLRAAMNSYVQATDPDKVISLLNSTTRPLVRQFLMRAALTVLGVGTRKRQTFVPSWADSLLYQQMSEQRFIYATFFEYYSGLALRDRKWSDLFAKFSTDTFRMGYGPYDWSDARKRLYEVWMEDPSLDGLLVPLAASLIAGGPPLAIDGQIELMTRESPSVRAAALLLNIFCGSNLADLTDEILWILEEDPGMLSYMTTLIYRADRPFEEERTRLFDLQDIARRSRAATRTYAMLERNYSRRTSGLGEAASLERLAFPLSVREMLETKSDEKAN